METTAKESVKEIQEKKLFQKKWEKENILTAVLLISYFSMWVIYLVADRQVMQDLKWGWDFSFLVENSIKYVLIGVLLYALPYEKIIQTIHDWGQVTASIFSIGELSYKVMVLFGMFAMQMGCYWILHGLFFGYSYRARFSEHIAIMGCLFTTLCMLYAIDMLRSKWTAFFIAGFVMNILCAAFVSYCCEMFVLAVLVSCVMYTIWLGYSIARKKTDWKVIFVSVFVFVESFFTAIKLTGHTRNWMSYLNPYEYINQTAVEMTQIIWKNKLFTIPPDLNERFLLNHPFTMVHMKNGKWILGLFLVLFVIFSTAVIWRVKLLAKRSLKRAYLAMAIYLFFAYTFIYMLLTDMGVMPVSALLILNNRREFPLLAIGLRTLWIRPVIEKEETLLDRFIGLMTLTEEDEDDEDDYIELSLEDDEDEFNSKIPKFLFLKKRLPSEAQKELERISFLPVSFSDSYTKAQKELLDWGFLPFGKAGTSYQHKDAMVVFDKEDSWKLTSIYLLTPKEVSKYNVFGLGVSDSLSRAKIVMQQLSYEMLPNEEGRLCFIKEDMKIIFIEDETQEKIKEIGVSIMELPKKDDAKENSRE